MLAAERLCKRYGHRRVLENVSVTIARGEVIGLLGPNGAGKTTCFYLIAGLLRSDGGRVTLEGIDVTQASLHRRAALGLGYLPQDASIFRQMTVRDNILAALELRDDLAAEEREPQLRRLLEELNIAHLSEQLGLALSGGERRRAEIARALAAKPRFLLLDEPFAGIDPISIGEMQRLVRQLKARDLGILITDHNVRETLSICDRAYIIHGGGVLAEGTPETILAHPEVRREYLGETFTL